MTHHFAAHEYVESDDGAYCKVVGPGHERARVCYQPAEHPIHEVKNPLIETIASRLARQPWRSDNVDLAAMSVHADHVYSSDCALCANDVHAIAAAVIDLLLPGQRSLYRSMGGVVDMMLGPRHPMPPAPPRPLPAPPPPWHPPHIHWDRVDKRTGWRITPNRTGWRLTDPTSHRTLEIDATDDVLRRIREIPELPDDRDCPTSDGGPR